MATQADCCCFELSRDSGYYPDDTRPSRNVDLMLDQRRRCWPSIKTTLGKCPFFAGWKKKKSNTMRWQNVELLSVRRCRLRADIKPALFWHLVFVEIIGDNSVMFFQYLQLYCGSMGGGGGGHG